MKIAMVLVVVWGIGLLVLPSASNAIGLVAFVLFALYVGRRMWNDDTSLLGKLATRLRRLTA